MTRKLNWKTRRRIGETAGLGWTLLMTAALIYAGCAIGNALFDVHTDVKTACIAVSHSTRGCP